MWRSNEQKGDGVWIALPACLHKISRHLALLACLLILGRASGRYEISELSLLGLTVAAAAFHLFARSFPRRALRIVPPQDPAP